MQTIDELDINRTIERNAQARLGARRFGDAAARTATPGAGINSIDQANLARARAADAALAENSIAQQAARAPSTPTPAAAKPAAQAASAGSRASRLVRLGADPLPKAASVAKGLTRAAGAASIAIPTAVSAVESYNTPTENFRERLGMDPNEGSVVGDIAARTAGTFQNVGNALTFGIADDIGQFIGDQLASARERGLSGGGPAQPPKQSVAAPAKNPEASTANTEEAGDAEQFYQSGNRYSDQPIATLPQAGSGRRGTVTVTPGGITDGERAFLAERKAGALDARARQQLAQAQSTAVEGKIAQRNALEETARRAGMNSRSMARGFQARGSGLALAALQRDAANAQDLSIDSNLLRTPEQEASLAVNTRRGNAQAAAEELQVKQGQRQQQILDQLQGIGDLTPEARRSLIDSALVGQGKDPDANRYESIEDIVAYDQFGTPVKARSLFDTRTQQRIGGGQPAAAPAVGQEAKAAPSLDEFLSAAKADPRNKGKSEDALKAYYKRTYGQ